MTKLEEIQAAEARLLIHTYDRFPVLFVAGEDVHLIDEDGNRYLDLLSGIGVNALGYSNKVIQETIAKQSRTLINASNYYFNDQMAGLAERVTRITGMDRVYFGNSGCEAVECALKLARAHAGILREEGKQIGTKFLALEQSFHGRTFGAISATYKEKYRLPFEPVVPGFEFVSFNDIEDLRAKFSNEVCGILIEAIQGEGGVRPLTPEFFAEARKLADSTGALLIVDEIQAGLGRTGKWCAYQHFGIMPDITTLAKPLAGGIPMSATLCTNEVARAFHAGMHGTTFGGGPLACAVASAVIDTIEKENLLDHINEIGEYFQAQLRKLAERHSCIIEVRGKGLMIAADLNSAELGKFAVTEMLKHFVVINCTSDTTLRFLPPYIFERKHVDSTVAALDKVFTAYAAAQAAV
ncbi:MAG: aspartate aminotransferase family protein [Terracidiphilus sp.]|jgi:acetylornithine aminotransferase/acetylornithine/N-succinyldiaminopimelate aminotransferase